MTGITELAQREKFEAWLSEKPLHARYMHWSNTLNAYDYTGIQLAWQAYQAGGAELVDALEKAQSKADVYDMLRDDYSLCEKGVGLADFVDWQAKRIAELDSRAVKLPQRHSMLLREDFNEDYHTEMAYKADEVLVSLAAACIKVEAE